MRNISRVQSKVGQLSFVLANVKKKKLKEKAKCA